MEYCRYADRMRKLSVQNGIPGQVAYWEREKRDTQQVMVFERSKQLMSPFGFHLQPFAITEPGTHLVHGRNFDWNPKPVQEINADDDFVLACHKAMTVARKVNAPLTQWHVFYPLPRKGWQEAFTDSIQGSVSWIGLPTQETRQQVGQVMRNGGWIIPLGIGIGIVTAIGVSLSGMLAATAAVPMALLAVHDPVLCAVPAVKGLQSDSTLHIQVARWE